MAGLGGAIQATQAPSFIVPWKKKKYYRQLRGFILCLEAVPRALGLLAYCQTNRVTPGLLVGALLRRARLGGL